MKKIRIAAAVVGVVVLVAAAVAYSLVRYRKVWGFSTVFLPCTTTSVPHCSLSAAK